MKRFLAVLVLAAASVNAQTITTESFGSGADKFSIDFVTIGNPGNPTDRHGIGSVSYAYNIGRYEVSRDMVLKAITGGGLGITLGDLNGSGGNGPNRPATGINLHEAAKFVNWLNTSSGGVAAYNLDINGAIKKWEVGDIGYQANNPIRNSLARYFLPSKDEWYKAAFGSPDGTWFNYATGSNTPPSPTPFGGGTEPNSAAYNQFDNSISTDYGPADINNAGSFNAWGTMAQAGNVFEWSETQTGSFYYLWGGSWGMGLVDYFNRSFNDPSAENQYGFRVAMIPEPSSLSLLLAGGAVLMAGRRMNIRQDIPKIPL